MQLHAIIKRSLRWSTIESVAYYAIFMLHTMLLFRTVDTAFYGIIGTLFALIYLLVTITNGGLDRSLGAFFSQALQDRRFFCSLIYIPLILQIALASLISIILALIYYILLNSFILEPLLLCIVVSLIISEGMKRNLHTLTHLLQKPHITALVEIITIASYVTTVWSHYYLYGYHSLWSIMLPMAITSWCCCVTLFFVSWYSYKRLPNFLVENAPLPSLCKRLSNQLFNYLNQLCHLIFTSNFIIPLLALHGDLVQAGLFKLVSSFVYSITPLVRKIFGYSSYVIFITVQKITPQDQEVLINKLSNNLNQVLYSIIIFFIINLTGLLAWSGYHANSYESLLLLLFALLLINENFFIIYETVYSAHNKAYITWLIHVGCGLFWLLSLYFTLSYNSLILCLILLVLTRITALVIIILGAQHYWKLKPKLAMPWTSVSYAFLFSCLVRLLLSA